MSRIAGLLVFVALLLVAVAIRLHASSSAGALLESEAQARQVLATLYDASSAAIRGGTRHPGLRAEFLEAVPDLQPLPDLGTDLISYSRDDIYMYGLATRSTTDASGAVRQGFILRAWPLDYGSTGDVEYQLSDDGVLWLGQNLSGRSGTSAGYPPRFPDPDVGVPEAAWWIIPLPDHR